jgi:hypothetical protein
VTIIQTIILHYYLFFSIFLSFTFKKLKIIENYELYFRQKRPQIPTPQKKHGESYCRLRMKAELSISGSEPQLMEAGKGDVGSITVYVRQWDRGYSLRSTIQESFCINQPALKMKRTNTTSHLHSVLTPPPPPSQIPPPAQWDRRAI